MEMAKTPNSTEKSRELTEFDTIYKDIVSNSVEFRVIDVELCRIIVDIL